MLRKATMKVLKQRLKDDPDWFFSHEAKRRRMRNWSDKEFEGAIRQILKPEFINEEIKIVSSDQKSAYVKGWLIAYIGGYMYIWRGNPCSIFYLKEPEEGCSEVGYVVYPSSPYEEPQAIIDETKLK